MLVRSVFPRAARIPHRAVFVQYQKMVSFFSKRSRQRTLEALFAHPTSANIRWADILGLFRDLGAEISEREGSRIAVILFDEIRVFHRPHPSPNTDKGAVVSIRKWLEQHGVIP